MADVPTTDGRRLRRDRNREAVVESLLNLLDQGVYDPSSEQIAANAVPPVSSRSLFRYFDDVHDLYRATIEEQQRRSVHIVNRDLHAGAPLADRIAAIAEQRAELWTVLGPSARTARLRAHASDAIADSIAVTRRFLRLQAAQLFAEELAAMPDEVAVSRLAAIDTLLEWESWSLFIDDRGFDAARASEALRHALTALLTPLES
mgnify:CR=1 FL=1